MSSPRGEHSAEYVAKALGSRPYSEVQLLHTEWVIPGLVPAGMLSVLAGDPKVGKSLLLVAWAAQLSRRGLVTCLLTAEDSAEHTTKARLMAAEADERLVRDVNERPTFGMGGEYGWFARVETLIRETDCRLMLVDPFTAFMSMESDSHKDQHARQVLALLAEIAEDTGCAIVYVMHLNKTASTNVLHRIVGSGAFAQVARSVLLMTPQETRKEDGRLLAHVACNVAELAPVQRWERQAILLPEFLGRPVTTARLNYTGTVEVDTETLLVPFEREEGSALEEAKDFLIGALATGPAKAKDLTKWAAEQGINPKTLRRAKDDLGIKAGNQGPATEWSLNLVTSEPGQPEPGQGGVSRFKPASLSQEPTNLDTRISRPGSISTDVTKSLSDEEIEQLGIAQWRDIQDLT